MTDAGWPVVRIGDLGAVLTGRTPPTEHPRYFGADYPFITPGDMRQGRSARVTQRGVSHEGARLLQRIRVPSESVCVSCIGWQMGEVIMTDRPSFTNQQINTIVPDKERTDPWFLYYSLRTRKQELLSLGATTGVRTPILNKSAFSDLRVAIPPLPLQRRIAGILSAYDDLIENSQRRIRILETMARALYREWFVHFRFAGHDKVPRAASALGDIPKGWEVRRLVDLVSFLSRGISPEYDEGGESTVINQKCVRDQSLNLTAARRQRKAVPRDKLLLFGDVLINSTGVGTLGRVAQVYEDLPGCTVDTHVTIARPADAVDADFFGCALLARQETFERLGVGATGQTELSRAAIGGLEISVPPMDILAQFGRLVRPVRSAAATLAVRIENLRRTRDLLLPRLMSGPALLGKTRNEPSVKDTLRRVFELKETLTDPQHPDAYFKNFEPSVIENPNKLTIFRSVERQLAELDDAGWQDLKGRAAAQLQLRDPVRGWQALWDTLGEAKGFVHLKRTGCTGVRFIPRSKTKGMKSPDLEAVHGARTVLCEVKTINTSKDEAERRKRMYEGEIVATEVKTRVDDKFLGKLRSTLEHAVRQLDAQDPLREARRIVFTVVHFDDSLSEHQDEYFSQIDEDLSKNLVSGAELVFSPAINLFRPIPAMKSATVFEFE